MSTEISNNKRIAKNTLYLYIRMLITLIVSLYTSRVILQNLGVDDFGIYNVVGGVIVLFSFISNALRVSSQRYVSYELGLRENGNPNRVFCMSIQCLMFLAAIILILAETVGLWFVNTRLNIPADRMIAAQWVYQITVITFVVNMIIVPFQATIIAYERMSFYAYVGVAEVFMKLGVALLIAVSPFDKLIIYALLILLVASITALLSILYCFLKIRIGRFSFVKDIVLFKNMLGFSGWSMVNSCSVITAQQGGNILLNIFNGVAANGAFGIANQVTGAVYHFVSNFQSAFQPQIVKQYSAKEFAGLNTLINRSSVFSYYLLLIIAVPFSCSADYVLKLWLGTNPEFAAGFCILMLVYFLLDAIEAPLWMLIGATGRMRVYSIWSAAINLFNIPISWILLKMGYSVYWVFIVRAGLNLVLCIIRPLYVRHLVKEFNLIKYLKALQRPIIVTLFLLVMALSYYLSATEVHPLYRIFISFAVCAIVIWFIGFDKNEKAWMKNVVIQKIKK